MAFDKEILGQERARKQLTNELNSERLAHAYIFVGPKGVGRTTTALALFKLLNCKAHSTITASLLADKNIKEACGICPSCRRIAQKQHEDLLILTPSHEQYSAQIKAEEIRKIIRLLSFPPFAGGWRLVLIHEANQLNTTSANLLLKTLEEPPAYNLLILVARETKEILPTLISRCRRINFLPLPNNLIVSELIRRGIDSESAQIRTILSAGSLGLAIELNYQRQGEILNRILKYIFSQSGLKQDWALVEELLKPFKNEERLDREGLANFLNLIAQYYRDQAVIAVGRPQTTMLPSLFLTHTLPIRTALNAFILIRQTQNQILSNVIPELALVVLLNALRQLSS